MSWARVGCAAGGFSNTLLWMAVSGSRQKLACLPLLTLGEMLADRMVHQSKALWALKQRNEAEETVPAAISTAAWWGSFLCPPKNHLWTQSGPSPENWSFLAEVWDEMSLLSLYTVLLVFHWTGVEQQWEAVLLDLHFHCCSFFYVFFFFYVSSCHFAHHHAFLFKL